MVFIGKELELEHSVKHVNGCMRRNERCNKVRGDEIARPGIDKDR